MTNDIPTKRANLCDFCGIGITHIIDVDNHPNDILAKETKDGKWKCGNCVERDIENSIVRSSPNSERVREIMAERKKKESHEQFLKEFEKRAKNVKVKGFS